MQPVAALCNRRTGRVLAIALAGALLAGALPLDLGRTTALAAARDPVTTPAPTPATALATWSALPNHGLNGTVNALAVVGTDLYVGGAFTQTKDGAVTDLNNIARLDMASGTWSALPHTGLSSYVNALAVIGSDLYVGGAFSQTKDGGVTGLNNIARFDTTGDTWSALPDNGLSGSVNALAVIGTDLYVGGGFARTFDNVVAPLWCLAVLDTTAGTWSAPDGGLYTGGVMALAVVGTDLYAGGTFSRSYGSAVTGMYQIARLDTGAQTWSALADGGMNDAGGVRALAAAGTDLYVAGQFTATYDGAVTNLHQIAKYDGASWSALAHGGLNGDVNTLAMMGTDLYVGGTFFSGTFDGAVTNLNEIARYDGSAWSALPNNGLNFPVHSLAVSGTDLYVGGDFSSTADGVVQNLWNIAKLSVPANAAPTDVGLTNANVDENQPAGAVVGTLSATDPDPGDSHTFSLTCAVPGADDASFGVSGADLQTNAVFDYEAKSSYSICVRADDGHGGTFDKGFAIGVNNVAESATVTFRSTGGQDGWILESSETSGKGGTLSSTATTVRVGDNATRRQYRGILSFRTSPLPDGATITKITVRVRLQGITGGGDPVTKLRGFMADIKKGTFGTSTLQLGDFSASASKTCGPFLIATSGGWYVIDLTPAKAYINKVATSGGLTQVRLRFRLDDNSNGTANYVSLYSGDASLSARPQLVIQYAVP